MNNINFDQVKGMLRIFVPVVLAYGVKAQWFSSEQSTALASAIVDAILALITLGSLVWSFKENSQTGMIDRTSKLEDVHQVVTTSEIADVTLKSNPKVVSK